MYVLDGNTVLDYSKRRGERIGPLDVLIAATALAHGATLVTRNLREFGPVPGLALANWFDQDAGRRQCRMTIFPKCAPLFR